MAGSTTTKADLAACYEGVVRNEWIDANGHMNLAYYLVLFDAATDVLLERIGFGTAYRETEAAALFAIEAHTIYRRELVEGDRVRIAARVLGATSKRVHVVHEMFHADAGCAAMQEILFLHVDLQSRRATAIAASVVARLQPAEAQAPPSWVGRTISL